MRIAAVRNNRRSGQAMVEFTLVGLLVTFVLISTFEIARTVWIYTTMAHAVKEGTRYAAMRGNNFNLSCVKTAAGIADPSICTLDSKKIAQTINNAGTGLVPADVVNVTMIANEAQTVVCPGADHSLNDCLNAGTPAGFDLVTNMNPGATFRITMRYRIRSMFTTISRVYTIPDLPASAQEVVQF